MYVLGYYLLLYTTRLTRLKGRGGNSIFPEREN